MKSRLRKDSSGFVGAMYQIEHLEGEIDEEGVEEILADGVEAAHVDGHLLHLHRGHVEEQHRGDSGGHGGKQEDDGMSGVDHQGLAFTDPKMKPT